MTDLATRVATVQRPAPKPATVISIVVLLALLVLGVLSIGGLGFSIPNMIDSLSNIPQFVERATPSPGPAGSTTGTPPPWAGRDGRRSANSGPPSRRPSAS